MRFGDFENVIESLRGGLIVSCQALPDEPLHGSDIMARMAIAAEAGGAAGIRANSPADVAAIRAATRLPIIGLDKVDVSGYDVYITPRVALAQALAAAGADIIAVDATARPRPEGDSAGDFIRRVKSSTGRPVMADISTLEEAVAAAEAGADIVSTTMSGYTPTSPPLPGPDFDLVRGAVAALRIPVFAEGRIGTPAEAAAALEAGAYAVVVGGAITRPQQITARFVRALVLNCD
ncbi:MAG: N-acetylmannosamine-6-phosphate 2-epimerase [Capsulimonadaceae bacterium]